MCHSGKVIVFAHISDTHFDGGERALGRVRRVMAYLRPLPLDAILVTGDIADHGAPHEYEQARAELTADVPVLILPGNHDDRSQFRKGLLGEDGPSPINQARTVGGVLFAMCDSSVPGRDDGLLAPQTLVWLREQLSQTDEPAFVCLHHPPVALHNQLLDGIRLQQADHLAELVEEFPHVVAVLCGHAHSSAASTFAGRPVLVAPGVVSTLRLPWTSSEELTFRTTIDLDHPPSVAFHVLDDDRRLTTHYRVAPPASGW
jgi:3',5'-cyclic-AMP phosphodiesterase